MRRAAVASLARLAALVESERTQAVDAIERLLDDESFLVALDAISAAESLGDKRLLAGLDRVAVQG